MAYKFSKGSRGFGDITFEDDADTGIDFEADTVKIETGGAERLVVTNSDITLSGDVIVDQYIKHNGDADTLINFADDKIVLKAGNLALVTAEKKGSAPHEVTINDGSNNVDFVVKGNGSRGGNPGIKFDASTNKLGINGVGTPEESLHVDGNIKAFGDDVRIKIDGDTDSHPGLELYENGTRKWIMYNDYTNDNLTFKTNSNVRMSIEQDGDVGIGTTSPIAKLDVAGKIAITAESSTPSQPSDGQGYLYTKTDGKIYWRSHDVGETDLTATGGGGGSSIDVLKVALASDTNFTWNGSSGDFHKVPFTRNLLDTFSGTPFNTSTNVFTAPSDGIYEFSVQLTFNNIQDDTTQYQAWLMTSVSSDDTYTISGMHAAALTQFDPPVSNSINRLDLFTVLDMAANQTITVYIRQIGGSQNNCHLLHNPMQTSLIIKKLS